MTEKSQKSSSGKHSTILSDLETPGLSYAGCGKSQRPEFGQFTVIPTSDGQGQESGM